MSRPDISALLFDVQGTLLDFCGPVSRALGAPACASPSSGAPSRPGFKNLLFLKKKKQKDFVRLDAAGSSRRMPIG